MLIAKTFTDGPDRFTADTADTFDLRFGAGNDSLLTRSGTTTAHMGSGNDQVRIFGGTATVYGNAGDDTYFLSDHATATISEDFGGGHDTVVVPRGMNYVLGGNVEDLRVGAGGKPTDNTTLIGNGLDNTIVGSANFEHLEGHGGNDLLIGGGGPDWLVGGDGNDVIVGGADLDVAYGGAGADTFVYRSIVDTGGASPMGDETIADWQGIDSIDLSAIDADTTVAGKQSFHIETSVGASPAHTSAGWLDIADLGESLAIYAYTDNSGVPAMFISVWSEAGAAALTSDNFIL